MLNDTGGNWSSEDCSSEQSVLCEVGADILPAPAEAMVSGRSGVGLEGASIWQMLFCLFLLCSMFLKQTSSYASYAYVVHVQLHFCFDLTLSWPSDGGTVTRDTWNSDDHMPDLRPCDR